MNMHVSGSNISSNRDCVYASVLNFIAYKIVRSIFFIHRTPWLFHKESQMDIDIDELGILPLLREYKTLQLQ